MSQQIIEAIHSLVDTVSESYNDLKSNQLDGSSMGNPANPVLANFVMDYVLRKIIDSLPFQVPFLKLYVDETLLAVPGDEVDGLLDHFNNFHEKIQFTMEREKDGELGFLDTIVIRMADGELRTKWFQKLISSGRLLNFNSHHPLAHKTSVALGLVYRAVTLSHSMYHQENLNKVRVILKRNNYPTEFINCCINKFNNKHMNDRRDNLIADKQENRCRFPYIRGLSQNIMRYLIVTDWKPAFYNIKKVGNIYTRLKDKVKTKDRSEVIYKINCSCGLCYIGQTKQYLKKRVYQHRYSCEEKNRDKENQTTLAAHHFHSNHNFDFENVKIIDSESNWWKRNISEMVQICLHDTVNLTGNIRAAQWSKVILLAFRAIRSVRDFSAMARLNYRGLL
ncbi:uncharacterized protein LOC123263989 [Cotesia glomerata]|uniref:uncharacterized protein LOC123263989 n=1 Tax=Cotesia glomerata TaxID=32391 RepID=UPI001D02625D|nr:uncharacterized protein LOC123263989 [Cotesia glomerata]